MAGVYFIKMNGHPGLPEVSTFPLKRDLFWGICVPLMAPQPFLPLPATERGNSVPDSPG